jgi:hypothetical protein
MPIRISIPFLFCGKNGKGKVLNRPIEKILIIVKLQGGLGNQMFQYAFGRALSLAYGRELFLDLTALTGTIPRPGVTRRKYELAAFPIKAKIADQRKLERVVAYPANRIDTLKFKVFKLGRLVKHYVEKDFSYDETIGVLSFRAVYFTGFWQSEKYFKRIADQIREDLFPPVPQDEGNIAWRNLIKNTNAVAVHVRRGDYVGNNTHPVCDNTYYEKAIALITKMTGNPTFFLFSDDMDWVRDHLITNCKKYYIDHNRINIAADLYLMSQCKHHIIANSSFSWWGAWLGAAPGKIIIAPRKWFHNPLTDTKDLLPKDWIAI